MLEAVEVMLYMLEDVDHVCYRCGVRALCTRRVGVYE